MHHRSITPSQIRAYSQHLRAEERSHATVESYLRAVRAFAAWQGGAVVHKQALLDWREHLRQSGYAPATINARLAALHSFFAFLGWDGLRVHYLRLQRRLFRDPARELSRADYERLRAAARRQEPETALLLETLAATGIRVSELRHITAQAVAQGRAEIQLKGKIRTILLAPALRKRLTRFARAKNIAHGALFRTMGGRPLSRYQVWARLKALAHAAGVDARRVFPHNLRRLFALGYYEKTRDLARLADILGHSSIETTRLYLTTSGQEHARQLDSLGFV